MISYCIYLALSFCLHLKQTSRALRCVSTEGKEAFSLRTFQSPIVSMSSAFSSGGVRINCWEHYLPIYFGKAWLSYLKKAHGCNSRNCSCLISLRSDFVVVILVIHWLISLSCYQAISKRNFCKFCLIASKLFLGFIAWWSPIKNTYILFLKKIPVICIYAIKYF